MVGEGGGHKVGGFARGPSYLEGGGISGRDESDKVETRARGRRSGKSERKEEVKRESGHSFIPLETDAG